MMDIKEVLLLWFKNYFIKKTSKGNGFAIKQNKQLAKELHKPIIKNFKKRKVY